VGFWTVLRRHYSSWPTPCRLPLADRRTLAATGLAELGDGLGVEFLIPSRNLANFLIFRLSCEYRIARDHCGPAQVATAMGNNSVYKNKSHTIVSQDVVYIHVLHNSK
jgi:hypothetical protein